MSGITHLIHLPSFVDITLCALLAFYATEGYSVGLITSLLDSFSFFIALVSAFLLYHRVSGLFIAWGLSKTLSLPLSFLCIACITEALVRILRFALRLQVRRVILSLPPQLSLLNSILGLCFGLCTGGILLMSLLAAMVILPLSSEFKSALSQSVIASFFTTTSQEIEASVSRVFGKPPTDLMTFFTIEPQEQSTVQLGFTVMDAPIDEESEKNMFVVLNRQREQNGLSSLTWDTGLSRVAEEHGKDMLSRGYFAHNTPEGKTPFDRMSTAGIVYLDAGENLAFSQSVDLAMSGLMNSPGHRANILSGAYHKIGIGVLDAGWYGKMFVQEFTN